MRTRPFWAIDADPFDMPSSTGKPSKATLIWRARQRELAAQGVRRICQHCARNLHDDETDDCRLCAVDISTDQDGA